jgi:flagellar FliL protein
MAKDASLDEDAPKPVDGEAAEGEEGAGEKKKLDAKKIVLFVVLPLFLLVGAGAGLYFTGTLDKFLKKESVEGEEHADAGHGKDSHGKDSHGKDAHGGKGGHGPAGPAFLEIPNMLVNLSGPDEQPRYLRLKVQLELKNQSDLASVQAVMPRVIDQFQTYLRELRVRDLRGSAGIYRLQMELLSRVNAAAYPVEVKDVLFQEILIQ